MKKFVTVLLLFSALVFAGCKEKNKAGEPEIAKRFYCQKPGFSILIPDNWEVKKDYRESGPVLFLSPKENNEDDFRENMNVTTENLQNPGLDYYYIINLNMMHSSMMNLKIIREERGQIAGGLPFRVITYSYTYQDAPLEMISYFYTINKTGFIVSGLAKPETFNKYLSVFNKIGRSLKEN